VLGIRWRGFERDAADSQNTSEERIVVFSTPVVATKSLDVIPPRLRLRLVSLECRNTRLCSLVSEQINFGVTSVIVNVDDVITANTVRGSGEWSTKIAVYQFKRYSCRFDWYTDDLSLCLCLHAHVACCVAMSKAINQGSHCCWMKVGESAMPHARLRKAELLFVCRLCRVGCRT
jgi:hypothetical protein